MVRAQAAMTRLDQPWHRPGAAWYMLTRRLPRMVHPPVSVYEPAPGSLSVLHNQPVVVGDGTTPRVNVAGRWLWPVNPLTGQFPAAYQKGPACRCTLHWGPDRQAR